MTRERVVEAYFSRKVRALGGLSIKLLPTEAGMPDRLVLMPRGKTYLVELKAEDGRVRPVQEVWHERATKRGHPVVVLYGKEEVDRWLEKIV